MTETNKKLKQEEVIHLLINEQIDIHEEQLTKAREELTQLKDYIIQLEGALKMLDEAKAYAVKKIKID